uniref:Uncharacterized protein n=1 Tax=Oryzias latipes TaxID=8090 RepID=A0A3B3I1L4_ORYLA
MKTRTSRNAPIVWELISMTDDTKKYLDACLNTFLTSAEKHFMVGFPVTFYVFTDQPEKVPNITLAPLRHLKGAEVQQVIRNLRGASALGESAAVLQVYFYKLPKTQFTYDRNPKSKAYMEEGDYYYHAAVFGGSCDKVKALADYCYLNTMEDKLNNVEALWHDESHLNKYFWLNKPSRILSSEYCFDPRIHFKTEVIVPCLLWAPKQYTKLCT